MNMTLDEFHSIIEQWRIDTRSFTLTGGLPPEKLVLEKQADGTWTVYYSERGQMNDLKRYDSESEALTDLLRRLVEDPTTRLRR